MDRGDVPATRVFLVDSRELLRLGIASLLSVQAEFEVVGEAARAVDVLPRVRATRPDVVLVGELSSDRPAAHDGAGAAGAGAGAAGVGAAAAMATAATAAAVAGLCRELRSEPEPPVCLLLTGGRDDRALADVVPADVAGCVSEDVHGGELVAMLHRLAAGTPLYDRHIEPPPSPPVSPDPLDGLSPTDCEIVALIGEGMTNRQIGARLGLSERTIKNHVSRVLAFLDMERRTQIAALASALRQASAG